MKVAFAGFLHETNTFAPSKAGQDAFRLGGGYIPMTQGPAMIDAAKDVNLGISGALDTAARLGWSIEPILWAGAIPSAHVTQSAYDAITDDILAHITNAGALDGVFLDLHGAMVAEHLDDGEGQLLRRVRAVVGPDVPMVAALDLHGNISRDMVEAADILVGFRTYPHVDMAQTGTRAAHLLNDMMRSGRRPAKAFRQMSYLVPIPFQCTDHAPAQDLYAELDRIEAEGVTSASLFMGFPAADIPDCGPAALAYAPTQDQADRAADRIAASYAAAEPAFRGPTYAPDAAIARACAVAGTGPVVIADTQDNPGAGGVSATTGLLRALLTAKAENAAIGLIVDPHAASRAHALGQGQSALFRIGGHEGLPDDIPIEAQALVETLSDGKIDATGPYYGGTRLDLGLSACLRIGGVRVVITSRIAQMADREMFRFVGITPEDMDLLVVKSSTHFRADFAPIARDILIACAPGPMPLDPADLPFTRLRAGMRLSPNGPDFPIASHNGADTDRGTTPCAAVQ
ncbi:M81 family metallopeptidase [Marivita sp. S0852]|uniref:M81 family metallopeptidase n=1 Tax=Marivita sp. S0852 TaxID=3373893 RepID=UPI003982308D